MTAQHQAPLRFITAGSVDDGKSTLIGRLLYDSKALLSDQIKTLESGKSKGLKETIDFSILTDGLEAEREQGITIDVAYRIFPRRNGNSSSPTRRGTNNTRAIWLRAQAPLRRQSCWLTHPNWISARSPCSFCRRPNAIPPSSANSTARILWWRSTKWTCWITAKTNSTPLWRHTADLPNSSV